MGAEPSRPRLLALFAEPLIYPDRRTVSRLQLGVERDEIANWLEDADVGLDFEPGSLDDLERCLLPSVTILHFSGHGNQDGLLLEDPLGQARLLRAEDLARILGAYNDGNLILAFLSACHSEEACRLVVRAGVPLVVGILRQATIADQAAREFARAFYRLLAQGRGVGRAFEAAKAGAKARFGSEADKFVLHFKDGLDPNQVFLFRGDGDGREPRFLAKAESPLLGVPHTGTFFGRARDLAEVLAALDAHRFVSVTGTGGMGKSALAGAVAPWFSRRRRFRDGVLWASLGEAGGPEVLLAAIPGLLNKDPVETVEQIAGLLADRDYLLVLDNLEDVLSVDLRETTRGVLDGLLRRAARLRILATTRERVGGLEGGEGWVDVGPLDEESALQLLIHRAPSPRPVENEIRVDPTNRTWHLSEPLRQLLDEFHGYPLAITTAAPHLRDSTVPHLLKRIREEGLAVFEDPTIRDPLERTRMRSLAVSLGLSERRLTEDGRAEALALFGLLSLFPAGLMKAAVSQIAPERLEENLRRLRDYSLVEHEPWDDRYYLLAPVRRFAGRHLGEDARRAAVQRAGLTFFLMAQALYENWPRLGAGTTATLLSRDEANFLAAIEMCREVASPEAQLPSPSLGIAASLLCLYNALHQMEAGRRLSDTILRDVTWKKDPVGLASVQMASGDLAQRRGQLDAADAHYQAAEALFRQIEDALGLANTLKARGDLARERGNTDRALDLYNTSLEIYVGIEEVLGQSNVLSEIAELHVNSGRREEAIGEIKRALKLAAVSENRYAIQKCIQLLRELGIDPEAFLRDLKQR